jgi:nicotinamide-nucleotide amidase
MTAADVVALLLSRHETVATCESLTAGLVLGELTTVAGSSAVVRGGLVTYATDLKTSLAGVDADLIREQGVVSRAVAEAMARGARTVCTATWGIGLTGVAGPDRVDGLPPGTVCIAVAGPDGVTSIQELLTGDRASVRRGCVERALELLGLACRP